MPSGKLHILGGLLAFVLVLYVADFLHITSFNLLLLPVWLLYSLLPDVDTRSMITPHVQKFTIAGLLSGGGFLYFIGWHLWVGLFTLFCGILLIGTVVAGHRTIFHSPVGMLFLTLPLIWVGGLWFFLAGVGGYAFHLLFDGELVKGGVAS